MYLLKMSRAMFVHVTSKLSVVYYVQASLRIGINVMQSMCLHVEMIYSNMSTKSNYIYNSYIHT